MNLSNIKGVVENELCTGCGTCVGICPYGAVTMHVSGSLFLPAINEKECTHCHLCVECCPGASVNFEELNTFTFSKQPKNFLLGNYINCYLAHSNDELIRSNASSGGLATQLVVFALEQGFIDGAVVTRMRKDKPLEPESFLARTRDEIVAASKSKYCPTSTNLLLRAIAREKGKFAIVGLPCQIHGIRKAENRIKTIREKIVLHIGLMCSHTTSFSGTEFLLEKLGIAPEQVAEISYRGEHWPGCMTVELVGGSRRAISYARKWKAYLPVFSSFFFTPKRCLMCPDESNELADISVGDAWLPELRKQKRGESIIIARTEKGEELLHLALSRGQIYLRSVEEGKVRSAQAMPSRFKKRDLKNRLNTIVCRGEEIPRFLPKPDSPSILSPQIRNMFVFLNVRASSSASLKKLLVSIPLPLFRLYYGIQKLLSFER